MQGWFRAACPTRWNMAPIWHDLVPYTTDLDQGVVQQTFCYASQAWGTWHVEAFGASAMRDWLLSDHVGH